MQNILKSPSKSIKSGELYKVSGRSNRGEHTHLARAKLCRLCRIGYDFMSLDGRHLFIGDNVSCVSLPFDENDIEFYEGSTPST